MYVYEENTVLTDRETPIIGLPVESSQKCYPIYVDKTHSNLRGSKNGVYKYVDKHDILNSININTLEPIDFSHPPFFLPESSLPLNFVYIQTS